MAAINENFRFQIGGDGAINNPLCPQHRIILSLAA
jgi:hypothetical protein